MIFFVNERNIGCNVSKECLYGIVWVDFDNTYFNGGIMMVVDLCKKDRIGLHSSLKDSKCSISQ